MRLAARVLGFFLLAGFALAQEQPMRQGVGGSNFHKNNITYSIEVETPHVDWASVLPGGPIKGFFIPPVSVAASDRPIMAVKEYGKGRVVAFAYSEAGFAPQTIDPLRTRIYWIYWEYQYALLAKAILWAAGRRPCWARTCISI